MKIILIGAGGMLGYVTYQYLRSQQYEVSGVTRTKSYPDIICLDATDQISINAFLERTPFDVIINCAAFLVKRSEERKSAAIKVNTWLPHYLEEFCDFHDKYLIQVSTDGVFSGKTGRYQERSLSDANTFYGKSKFLGEVMGDHALTIRSGFWGADVNPEGYGLFQWFARQEGKVFGYSKAVFNGVSNLEFAKFVVSAIQNRWTGVYHLCASDIISKYSFLNIEKEIFKKETEVIADEGVSTDRSLVCTRSDIHYQQKTFRMMMTELRDWMAERTEFTII